MSKFKKMGVGIIITVATLALVGCGEQSYERRLDTTVATVGKEKIKLKEIDRDLKNLLKTLEEKVGKEVENNLNLKMKEGTDEEKKLLEEEKDNLIKQRKIILDRLMKNKILALKGREINLITDEMKEKANKMADHFNKIFIESYMEEGMSREEAEKKIQTQKKELISIFTKDNGMTVDELIKCLEDLSLSTLMEQNIMKSIVVTDDEIEKYYNDNINEYVTNIRQEDEVRTLEKEKEYIRDKIKYEKKNEVLKGKLEEYAKELNAKYYTDKLEF